MSNRQNVLVIGAGSAIAQAVLDALNDTGKLAIVAVRRHPGSADRTNVTERHCDYSPAAIQAVVDDLKTQQWIPDRVFICNGILHGDAFAPEKQLAAIDEQAWMTVLHANALVPMLWLQSLITLLPRKQAAKIVLFSARVGSLTDNRLGGWYSYRASKAALNMMVKTAAIELRRTHQRVGVLLFHPGTTDTPLSKPFQNNVPEGKLFTPGFVAEQVLRLMEQYARPGEISYRDWAGEEIPW